MLGQPTGLENGKLRPCPRSPNCVSSLAEDTNHRIDPIPFTGPADQAMDLLRRVISFMPGSRIVSNQPNYLHAEFTTRFFRFVDDFEALIDTGSQVIEVRSASRTGYTDLGANRRRVEEIRRRFRSLAGSGKEA